MKLRDVLYAKGFAGGSGGGANAADSLIDGSITEYSSDKVKTVVSYAFYNQKKLESVKLPNVENIGSYAFYSCSSLKEVEAPLFKEIQRNTFTNCSNLQNVTVSKVTQIGVEAFRHNAKLSLADFAELTSIELTAFGNCTSLYALIIRNKTLCILKSSNAFSSSAIAAGTGYIYVPSALVEDYKAAANWSTYADQIRAIEDYPEITGG